MSYLDELRNLRSEKKISAQKTTSKTSETLPEEVEEGVLEVLEVPSANKKNKKTRLPELAAMDDCPEPKAAKQEWVAAVCCCRFNDCTMWNGRRPLECCWSGEV